MVVMEPFPITMNTILLEEDKEKERKYKYGVDYVMNCCKGTCCDNELG